MSFILIAMHKEIFTKAHAFFGNEFNEKLFREQLSYFKDINYEEEVIYMPGFKTSAKTIERVLTRFSTS